MAGSYGFSKRDAARIADAVKSYERDPLPRRPREKELRFGSGTTSERVAIVISSAQDGSNLRWVYTMQWAANGGTGYGMWTGSGDTFTAYNLAEAINGTTGKLGNGLTVEKIPAGFALQPAPTNSPHAMVYHSGKWWFEYENGIDGECEA